jgi:hypothetical protein
MVARAYVVFQAFQTFVSSVLSGCCKSRPGMLQWAIYACCKPSFNCFMCFRRLFQMFHLDVSKIDLGVAHVAMAPHACFKYFICLGLMLQMFHLDVSKVNRVLQAAVHLLLRVPLWLACLVPDVGRHLRGQGRWARGRSFAVRVQDGR